MPAPDAIRPVGAGSVLVGRYRLVRLIAQGGMAAVWEAQDGVLARSVALKMLHPHLAADQLFLERFRREAVSAARLSHPNVVATFDAGVTPDGTAFIVMELIRGRTLSVFEAEQRPVAGPVCVEIGKQIADALAHAHAAGLVHRDVKPANVLVCDSGADALPFIKVTDFGIAKAAEGLELELTKTGMVLGTPKYLSPEQISGYEPDARADIYALGLVLFEVISGRAPFTGPTEMAVAVQHLNDEPPRLRDLRPSVPPPLDDLVAAMLAKRPEDRPQSAQAVRRALLAIEAQGRAARAGRPPLGAAVTPTVAFGRSPAGQGSGGGAPAAAGHPSFPGSDLGALAGHPSFPGPDAGALSGQGSLSGMEQPSQRSLPGMESPAGTHPVPTEGAAARGMPLRPPVVAPVGPGVFVPGGAVFGLESGEQEVAAAGPRSVPVAVPGSALEAPWPPDAAAAVGAAAAADWFAPGGGGGSGGDFSPPPAAPPPAGRRGGPARTSGPFRTPVAEYDPSSRRLAPPGEVSPGRHRRHNTAGWLVAVLVVAALIVVLIVASEPGSGGKPKSVASTTVPAATPVVLQNVSVFHLERDADDVKNVGNVIDGDPTTSWNTDTYFSPTFAGLRNGLGLAFTLQSSHALHHLTVTSPTAGWSAEVFVANAVPNPAALAPWGQAVATQQSINGSTVFDLGGHRGAAILLWITNLGPTAQTVIDEVSAS